MYPNLKFLRQGFNHPGYLLEEKFLHKWTNTYCISYFLKFQIWVNLKKRMNTYSLVFWTAYRNSLAVPDDKACQVSQTCPSSSNRSRCKDVLGESRRSCSSLVSPNFVFWKKKTTIFYFFYWKSKLTINSAWTKPKPMSKFISWNIVFCFYIDDFF